MTTRWETLEAQEAHLRGHEAFQPLLLLSLSSFGPWCLSVEDVTVGCRRTDIGEVYAAEECAAGADQCRM